MARAASPAQHTQNLHLHRLRRLPVKTVQAVPFSPRCTSLKREESPARGRPGRHSCLLRHGLRQTKQGRRSRPRPRTKTNAAGRMHVLLGEFSHLQEYKRRCSSGLTGLPRGGYRRLRGGFMRGIGGEACPRAWRHRCQRFTGVEDRDPRIAQALSGKELSERFPRGP